jgi:predicted ATP-grasp superfamily ATP-dependent carboligase
MMQRVAAAGAPVLVFNLGHNAVQHGALGVIRTLGRMGVDVYAVVDGHLAPGAVSRYTRGSFVWKAGDEEPEQIAAGLLAIGERIGRKAILVATDDRAAALVAERAEVLEQAFVFPHPPRCLPRRLSNKRELYLLCKEIGIPCPETVCPVCLGDVHAFIERAQFPVIVKAADAQCLPKGMRSTSIVRTPAELLRIYEQTERSDGPNLIFQEYIARDCGEDWIFHGYTNPQTGRLLAFTGKKLRSYPPFAGLTTLGIPAANETLYRQSERLLKATGYAGIMDLDYRFDSRDGQYKLLDFNPRIGANFRMFENPAGIDVARAMYLDLSGQTVPQSPLMKERKFVVESHDWMAGLGYIRNSELTARNWWGSLKGRKELAWFSKEDPLPALLACSRLVARMMMRAVRKSPVRARRIEPRKVPAKHPAPEWNPRVGGD